MFSYLSLAATALSVCMCFHISLSQATLKEEIRMPGIKPSTEDYYVCTSVKVTEEKYITQYEAIANGGTAHHILLFGCDQPYSNAKTWECGATCSGRSSIMFAWAKNADPTKLPQDVGYHIGGSSGINNIVMQVHYARALTDADPPDTSGIAFYTSTAKTKYTQGILLMSSNFGRIPPHKEESHLDISCHSSNQNTIHPFAYRTHAHSLSTVISAYRRPASQPQAEWEMLGKGNPQWPQAFYPMDHPRTIDHNDILVARCVFNSTGRDTVTRIGSTHMDEMCNFYMMYYVEGEAEFLSCAGNNLPNQARSMPAASLQPLPPNPLLDEIASGHHHHGSSSSSVDMVEVKDWYKEPTNIKIGQLGGVDTDSQGNLIIFHRGSNVWDASSFDQDNVYSKQYDGAIPEKTLVQFNKSGVSTDAWGDNLFYMPHGITIDKDDNVWLTDVALHQVFKFTATERTTPSIKLGKEFQPGSDEESFCKPTDVAVMNDGSFYVADGYCNGRILHFTKEGHVIRKWGSKAEKLAKPAPYRFTIVHSLALSESKDLLCAADRNNYRIQCFNLEGKFQYKYDAKKKVFAVAFRPNSDKLVVVTSSQTMDTGNLLLLKMNTDSAQPMGEYTPQEKEFSVLHDVAVSGDGNIAYIAQLQPAYVYQFTLPLHLHPSHHNEDNVKKVEGMGYKPLSINDSEIIGSNEGSTTSQRVPIVVAVILTVPIACVLLAILFYKICSSRNRGVHGKFDMGNIFTTTPRGDMTGFSPLATHEDHYTDDEDDFTNEKKTFVKP